MGQPRRNQIALDATPYYLGALLFNGLAPDGDRRSAAGRGEIRRQPDHALGEEATKSQWTCRLRTQCRAVRLS